MITRADVADLRVGDVVEVRSEAWPDVVISGPLAEDDGHLILGAAGCIRCSDGAVTGMALRYTLTVVSRAPRPLYVNHDRTEPVSGDVVRDADGGHNGVWLCTLASTSKPWIGSDDWYHARDTLPDRLRLLVDGETGQVVP